VHSPVSTHDPYPNPSSRSRLNIRNIVSSHLHSLATSSAQRSSCRHTPSSHTRLNPSRAHARTRAHPRRAVLAALVASCPTAGRHANSASCQHSKRNSTHVHVHQNVGNQAGHFVLGPRTPQRAPQRLSSSLIISSCSMRPSCHGASRGAAGAKSFQANPSFSQSRGWDRRRAAQTGRAAVPNPPDRSCRALRARGLRAPPRLIRRR
jgi:hypothetical protein